MTCSLQKSLDQHEVLSRTLVPDYRVYHRVKTWAIRPISLET